MPILGPWSEFSWKRALHLVDGKRMRRWVGARHPGLTWNDGLCYDEVSWTRFLPTRWGVVPQTKETKVRLRANPKVLERSVSPVESESQPFGTM